jgi:hypothetical protein
MLLSLPADSGLNSILNLITDQGNFSYLTLKKFFSALPDNPDLKNHHSQEVPK